MDLTSHKSIFSFRAANLALFLALAGLLQGCKPVPEEKPNVLFIMVDDLRTQLGCYGYPGIVSPNIDQLASEGLVFLNSYCNIPVCGASRASIMSGLRGTPTRFVNWFCRLEEDVPGAVSLPGHFKENGYTTISMGKTFHHRDDHEDAWSETPWRWSTSFS